MSAVRNISAAVQSGRTTARRVTEHTEELLRRADQRGLNAALDWSPEYLSREATRVTRDLPCCKEFTNRIRTQ